ncbi:MAG: 2-dehydropantoate 2-reductase [Alphaproteobacteria bacterium]|nr:2-dehydropantoate 2-reductase [Alphaproteobacteria bacterium]
MRICVFGAGAIGGHMAARLAAAGHDVSVVARGAHLAAMRAQGITLRAGEQVIEARVTASDDAAALGPQEAVLITAKANALSPSAPAIAALLGEDTPAVFVQNGIPWWYALRLTRGRPTPPDLSRLDPGGALRRAVGERRTIGAVVLSSNEVVAPGVIVNHTPQRNLLTLGEIDDRPSRRVDALRTALRDAGIASPDVDDIRTTVWQKLVRNLSRSTLCCLVGETIRESIGKSAALREIAKEGTREGLAIAAAHGIVFDYDIDADFAPTAMYQPHKPSILQDYELGRPMEIEALLRTPLAFARAAGLRTPTLDTLVALIVHRAKAGGLYDD